MKGYPGWFLPALLGALALMFVTGALLAPTTLALRADCDLPWRLPGSGRLMTAALHAAGGFALMLLVGALWAMHMRSGWRRRLQRTSGVVLGVLLLVLAASAVAVYYVGDQALGTAMAFIHLGSGLLLAGPFGWHWARGRRSRRNAHVRPRAPRSPSHTRRHQPQTARQQSSTAE